MLIPVVTAVPVSFGTIISTATSTSLSQRPSASAETAGEQSVVSSYVLDLTYKRNSKFPIPSIIAYYVYIIVKDIHYQVLV